MPRQLNPADLPEDIARRAQAQVAAGRFATVEEVVRAGIKAIERSQHRHDTQTAALRAALEEGERSGVAEDSSLDGVLAEFRAKRQR